MCIFSAPFYSLQFTVYRPIFTGAGRPPKSELNSDQWGALVTEMYTGSEVRGGCVMSHVDLRAAGSVPGVCGSLKIKLWPRSMATTSGLSVSPVLGVSVIAWLADHVRSGVHAGAGSWELVKKHAGGFLWCALECAPSPVLASPVRIRIRLLNE